MIWIKRRFCELNAERYFIIFVNEIRSNYYNLGISLTRKIYVYNVSVDMIERVWTMLFGNVDLMI